MPYYDVTIAFSEDTEKGVKITKQTFLVQDVDTMTATTTAIDLFGTNGEYRVTNVAEKKYSDVSLESDPQRTKARV